MTQQAASSKERLLWLLLPFAWAWTLWLPFQLDDYTQIPEGIKTMDFVFQSGQNSESGPEGVQTSRETRYLFRPLLWALWYSIARIDGEPLNPAVFHGVSIALHILCTLAFYLVAKRLVSQKTALIASWIFALHPAGSEAVSWIAAGGDLLATMLAAIACLCALSRPRSAFFALLGGIFLGLGLLAKESVLVLPAILVFAFFRDPDNIRTLKPWAQATIFLLPFAAAMWVRMEFLGNASLNYAGGLSPSLQILPKMSSKVLDYLAFMAFPWNIVGDPDHTPIAARVAPAIVKSLMLGGWVAVHLLGLILADKGLRRRQIQALLALALTLAPALFAAPSTEGTVFGRTLYLPMVPWILGITFAAEPILQRKWGRKIVIPTTIVVSMLWIDAGVHQALDQLDSVVTTQNKVVPLRNHLRDSPTQPTIIVIDPEPEKETIAALGPFFKQALSRPFTLMTPAIHHHRSYRDAFMASEFADSLTEVAIFEVNKDRHVILMAKLPKRPESLPDFRLISETDLTKQYEPEETFPPRCVSAWSLDFEPGPPVDVRFEVLTEESSASSEFKVPSRTVARTMTFASPASDSWRLSTVVRSVVITGSGAPFAKSPKLLRDLPLIQLESPRPGDRLLVGKLPTVAISSDHAEGLFKITFEVALGNAWFPAMIYSVQADRFESKGGWLCWQPSLTDKVESPIHQGLRWEHIRGYFEAYVTRQGLSVSDWRIRVESASEDGSTLFARSAWVGFEIGDAPK